MKTTAHNTSLVLAFVFVFGGTSLSAFYIGMLYQEAKYAANSSSPIVVTETQKIQVPCEHGLATFNVIIGQAGGGGPAMPHNGG